MYTVMQYSSVQLADVVPNSTAYTCDCTATGGAAAGMW
jgi:hypothetical protein